MFSEALAFRLANKVDELDTASMESHVARPFWPGMFAGETPVGAVVVYFRCAALLARPRAQHHMRETAAALGSSTRLRCSPRSLKTN
jgi:hypothetical protein